MYSVLYNFKGFHSRIRYSESDRKILHQHVTDLSTLFQQSTKIYLGKKFVKNLNDKLDLYPINFCNSSRSVTQICIFMYSGHWALKLYYFLQWQCFWGIFPRKLWNIDTPPLINSPGIYIFIWGDSLWGVNTPFHSGHWTRFKSVSLKSDYHGQGRKTERKQNDRPGFRMCWRSDL